MKIDYPCMHGNKCDNCKYHKKIVEKDCECTHEIPIYHEEKYCLNTFNVNLKMVISK